MKNLKQSVWMVFFILLVVGCATRQDMRQMRAEYDEKISVNARDVVSLKQENLGLRNALESHQAVFAALREAQAASNADVSELRERSQRLSGSAEELRKDLTDLIKATQKKDEDLQEKLDRASFKLSFMENFLGIGKKDAPAEGDEKGRRTVNGQKDASINGKSAKESLYGAAYESFREGKYEKARTEFENFLKLHPRTEYSGNAQFWIGESFYNEGQYEKAILEYEKVVKNYPDGNKTPYALLKQGLSFEKLGDKTSARMILQQIIRDYPNTNQARVARATLLEIK